MRISWGTIVVSAAVSVSAWFASGAGAAAVIDQNYRPANNENFNIGAGTTYVAQTVTAGLTGYLTEADLYVYRFFQDQSTPWEVTIRALNGSGAPTGTILASQTLPATAASYSGGPIGSFHDLVVDFDTPTFVHAGDQFAIAIRSPGFVNNPNGVGGWGGSFSSPYSGGATYDSHDGSTFSKDSGGLIFTTYVAVPEPASMGMIGGAVALLGLRRHRRRRR